jgi:predicted RNA binding protein YcfA (HicA-like mRNA interferase family)
MARTSELIRRLARAGFSFLRHGKKHDIYANQAGRKLIIPRHSKEIADGLYHAIIRDAGLGEFRDDEGAD